MTKQPKWNKGVVFFVVISFCSALFIVVNGLLNVTSSNSMSGWIMNILFPKLPDWHITYGQYQTVIRKIAHLAEYGALGMWLWFFKLSLATSGKKITGWFFCFLLLFLGVLDEFLQSFSQRSATVSDIVIDLLGGLLGMAGAMAIHRIWKICKNRRNHHG